MTPKMVVESAKRVVYELVSFRASVVIPPARSRRKMPSATRNRPALNLAPPRS
jgi:hypothetical protein